MNKQISTTPTRRDILSFREAWVYFGDSPDDNKFPQKEEGWDVVQGVASGRYTPEQTRIARETMRYMQSSLLSIQFGTRDSNAGFSLEEQDDNGLVLKDPKVVLIDKESRQIKGPVPEERVAEFLQTYRDKGMPFPEPRAEGHLAKSREIKG